MNVSPQLTLALGIGLSFYVRKHPVWSGRAKRTGTYLLQLSVVLLGAGLNFHEVIELGAQGLLTTFIGLLYVALAGFLLAQVFRVERTLATLLTAGTAICGGSAIAALAPVIAADQLAITMAISIVFLLNAVAVFLFPLLGEWLQLSQSAFGELAALAIHDTSSVVAAGQVYGARALEVASTIKLTRALWILPLTIIAGLLQHREKKVRSKVPWFIVGFVALSLIFSFVDGLDQWRDSLRWCSKLGFAVTLFFVGLGFDFTALKRLGMKPLIFAFVLWVVVIITAVSYVVLK